VGYRLGIDLGTTYTAAAVEEGGRAEAVQLGDHAPQIPSAVFVREDGELLFGEAAVRRGAVQPDRLEREFKRRLGDRTPYVLGGREITADQLTAHLLRWVVAEVMRRQQRRPDRITLTHPANWGAHRRGVLLEAVRLSGVGAVTTVTEPAAAAVHYSSTELADVGDVVAVYDLGGGTFDAAVMRKTVTEFELLGTPEGIERLGGVDFDQLLFGHVCRIAGADPGDLDWESPSVVSAFVRLRRDCVEAKEMLSSDVEAPVVVALPGAPERSVRLTRGEFEAMVRSDVDRTVRCLSRALESAHVGAEEVRSIVLVGGSARIPLVAEALGHELGRPVTVSTQPKLAVALGAALLAGGVMPSPPGAAPRRRAALTSRSQEGVPASGGPTGPGNPSAAATGPVPAGSTEGHRRGGADHPGSAETTRPRSMARMAAGAGASLALAALLAFVAPHWSHPSAPGGVRLNDGAPVGSVIFADLDDRFVLSGVDGADLRGADVRVRALGIPLGRGRTDAAGRAVVDLRAGQFIAGPVTVTVTKDGRKETITLRPTDPALGGVLRWAAPLLLLLFASAYAEAVLRRVWRRRRAGGGEIAAMAGVGSLAGVALLLASWAGASNAVPGLVALAVLLAAGLAGGLLAPLQAALAMRRARSSAGRTGPEVIRR
jgi:molecular chaperone DnaK